MPRGAVSDAVHERAKALLRAYLEGEIDGASHKQLEVAAAWGVKQSTISSLAGYKTQRQRFTYDRIRQLAELVNKQEWEITGETPSGSVIQRDVVLAFLVRFGVQKELAEVVAKDPDRWRIEDVAHCNRRSASLSQGEWRERLDRAAGLDAKTLPPASNVGKKKAATATR